MNVFHLKYFTTVAECTNFTRAARILRVSQPALSQQIQSLEAELNTKLFERTNKGVILTQAGKLAYEHSKKVFTAVSELKNAVEDLNEGVSGELYIGTVNSIGIHILPKYMKILKERFPSVKLSVAIKPSDEVLEMLRRDEINAAIIATNEPHLGMSQIDFLKNEILLVASPEHEIFNEEKITTEALSLQNLIAFDKRTPTRSIIDEFLRREGISMKQVFESENIETIKTMAGIGMGVAFIPEHAIRLELKAGVLKSVDIQRELPKRNVSVLYKKSSYLTKPTASFLSLFNPETDFNPHAKNETISALNH